MQEMDRRVGLLRLSLADIADRERRTKEVSTQLRAQLTRIVDFTVQFNGGVANALSALAEVEERLATEEMTLRHLSMLRQRIRRELDTLVVTREVADARARLTALEARRSELLATQPTSSPGLDAGNLTGDASQQMQHQNGSAPSGELAAIDAEIAELRAAIEAASDAAARALTEGRGQ
jgi:hypothetical protein